MAENADNPKPAALIWAEPGQCDLLRQVAERAGLRIVSAGSPLVGRAGEVASALTSERGGGAGSVVEPVGDLRAALISTAANVVIVAAPGEFCDGAHDRDDLAALESARARGVRVFAFEPIPGSLLQCDVPRLAGGGGDLGDGGQAAAQLTPAHGVGKEWGGSGAAGGRESFAKSGQAAMLETLGGWAGFGAPLRVSSAMREACDLLEPFGPVLTCIIECLGTPVHGSLGARFFDAADVLIGLMGRPESVNAVYVPASRARGLHAAPGERLQSLDGNISMNARFADGRSGVVVASNRAGCWTRGVTLLGDKGRIRIDDTGFEWIGSSGESVDITRKTERRRSSAAPDAARVDGAIGPMVEHIIRALDPRTPAAMPTDYREVLATTGAGMLSARTGEVESPETILRMARGG